MGRTTERLSKLERKAGGDDQVTVEVNWDPDKEPGPDVKVVSWPDVDPDKKRGESDARD